MKYRLPLLVTAVVFAVTPLVCLLAQEATPPAAPATAAQPASPVVLFNAVFTRITEKVAKGPVTAEDIAPELKEMDTIIAQLPDQRANEYGTLYLIRARVYIELLEDYPKGLALLKDVKTIFPKVYASAGVSRIVNNIEEKMANDGSFYIGKVFPPLDEKDLNGKSISTAKLKGKIVLVSFWASFSSQCIADLTTQAALYQNTTPKALRSLASAQTRIATT